MDEQEPTENKEIENQKLGFLDKAKILKDAFQAKKTFDKVSRMKGSIGGMPPMKFVSFMANRPAKAVKALDDDEFHDFFSHPSIYKLFDAMPKVKTIFETEMDLRIKRVKEIKRLNIEFDAQHVFEPTGKK